MGNGNENNRIQITGGTIGIQARGSTSIISTPDKTASLMIEGNLNYRNLQSKRRYNDWLLGTAYRIDLGHKLEHDGSDVYSNPPGWTLDYTGKNQPFVINNISSSLENSWNVRASGPIALETSAVPASASAYYSKKGRFVKQIYKLSASADLINDVYTRSDLFTASLGLQFSASMHYPAEFKIDVPDYGRIVDIKIWVEFFNNSGSADDESFDANDSFNVAHYSSPLACFNIALQSPNSTGFISVPLWNDRRIKDVITNATILQKDLTNYEVVALPKIWQNTYVLWMGRSGTGDFLSNFENPVGSWNKDRNMRTVFWDSSRNKNPAGWSHLYRSGSIDSVWANNPSYLNGINSPNQVATADVYGKEYGNDVPWTSDAADDEISGVTTYTGAGSPPDGWLTGGGGVAAVGEFATTGSNYGPENIKPHYPMLDNIVEAQATRQFGVQKNFEGRRPGLRGTEIHGTWTLLVATNPFSTKTRYLSQGGPSSVLGWFRQWRLEVVYDTGYGLNIPGHDSRFSRKISTTKPGKRLQWEINAGYDANNTVATRDTRAIVIISNVFEDNLTNITYTSFKDEPGITGGITSNTSSTDFAVFSRITGTLADTLSSSSPHWYLSNEFGTPYIPLSTGSAETPAGLSIYSEVVGPTGDIRSAVSEVKSVISDVLKPKPTITKALTLRSVLADYPTTRTTRDTIRVAAVKATGSTILR